MRLGRVQRDGTGALAVEKDGVAYDLRLLAKSSKAGVAAAVAKCEGMEGFLRLGQAAVEWAAHVEPARAARIAKPRWLSPVSRPQKICAIGLNYADHCREQGLEPPKSPILFAKYPSAIVGPGDEITWDPALTSQVDWEAELGVVIGETARRVPAARAYDHIAGYLCANDVTARNLQKGDGQYTRGKSLDTFCPLGPYLVSRDAVPDPHRLAIRLRVNGVLKQDSSTSNLIFKVPELVEFLSRAFTLYPGDVILTGTPPGVGMHRKPPEFLQDGDRVEVEIEGLGRLENACRTSPAA